MVLTLDVICGPTMQPINTNPNLPMRWTTNFPSFMKIKRILSKQGKENGTDVSAEFPVGGKIATGQSLLPSMTTKNRNLLLWD